MPFRKKSTPSTDHPKMKTIAYRGGIVTFRIPTHWREEYSDTDGGMLYEEHPDSGTLRLTIITMTVPEQRQETSALDVLWGSRQRLGEGRRRRHDKQSAGWQRSLSV
jgi:hypothetical protein